MDVPSIWKRQYLPEKNVPIELHQLLFPIMFKSYWLSLRFIANDVSLLFRNFLHWNLSKIAILVVTLVTSIVVSMPLVVIGYWMGGDIVAGLGEEGINDLLASGALPESVVSALIENYWIMGGIALLALLILTVFTVFMTYGYYLTSRVYESYINGNRLSIFRNEYWNLPRIWKFIGVINKICLKRGIAGCCIYI